MTLGLKAHSVISPAAGELSPAGEHSEGERLLR